MAGICALGRRCGEVRGLGLDGFQENVAQATRLAQQEGLGDRLHFVQGDALELKLDQPADLIAMNRALHHVWEGGVAPFIRRLRDNLRPGGAVAIWEAGLAGRSFGSPKAYGAQPGAFLTSTSTCRAITCFTQMKGLAPEIYRFADGIEANIVARRI